MKRSLSEIISLDASARRASIREFAATGEQIEYGALVDPVTGQACPVIAGFPIFTDAALPQEQLDSLSALRTLEQEWFGDAKEYDEFVANKWRRPNRDAYAAFQPFNESTRAFYPLVELLRQRLQPGDLILDTWCRTGWTGELLAGLFPEQQIVSIWEGNQGVLGYRAFRHWLPHQRRAANLDILFHDVNQPLPFVSGSFAAVVGLDTLHRYDVDNLLRECQRVCVPDAPIIFPHVHLTNSEPDPWFDRGCRQESGDFWQQYLEQARSNNNRSVFIESEMALFAADASTVLRNNPNTSHYNALVGLVPVEWEGARLAAMADVFPVSPASYAIVNPLLRFDLDRQQVELDLADAQGMTEHILQRHPGYAEFLEQRLQRSISATQVQFLYWASNSHTLADIAIRMGLSDAELRQLAAPMVAADMVLLLPISAAMAALNHYYARQEELPLPRRQTLPSLWQDAVQRYPERVYLTSCSDEIELSYEELDQLVEIAAGRLLAEVSDTGAVVMVAAQPGIESVLIFWACQRAGLVFAAIDPGWSPQRITDLARRHRAALLFTDLQLSEAGSLHEQTQLIVLETEAAPASGGVGFEQWLEDETVAVLPEDSALPEATAVVLFTSGSTGSPKAVALSQRALWQSATSFSRYYNWQSEDVFLSLGHFATMSGLRNPLLVSATVGGRFLIPDSGTSGSVLEAVALAGREKVTVIGVVPAFLKQLAALAGRLDRQMFAGLRLVLSTAANLPTETVALLDSALGVKVRNYYGLTETCGACIYMPADSVGPGNLIGHPVAAVAQIVTDEGRCVSTGEAGELRIYSGNLMQGYLEDPASSAAVLRDGWLYTGDVCRWSEQGLIELLDRKRDVIKAPSGALVYLSEVERALVGLFSDAEYAVIAVVDEQGLERLVCCLESNPGVGAEPAAGLLQLCNARLRERLSPDHQLFEIAQLAELPRGSNQKIQRAELARRLRAVERHS